MIHSSMFRRRAAGIVATAALMSALGATSAQAAEEAPARATQSTSMTFGGYDSGVAAAHGYEIITALGGMQFSVPVTEAARKEAQSAGTAAGDCGTSFVNAAKLSNDTLAVTTGYQVPFPVAEKTWRVLAQSLLSSHVFPWDGPSGGAWSSQAAATVPGPGVAGVTAGSHVVGTNGRVCYSGLPTAAFG
jgi:hypothetical protein